MDKRAYVVFFLFHRKIASILLGPLPAPSRTNSPSKNKSTINRARQNQFELRGFWNCGKSLRLSSLTCRGELNQNGCRSPDPVTLLTHLLWHLSSWQSLSKLLPLSPPFLISNYCFSPNPICLQVSFSIAFCACSSLYLPYSFPLLSVEDPTYPSRSSLNATLPIFPKARQGAFLSPFVVPHTHLCYCAFHMLESMVFVPISSTRSWALQEQGLYLFHFSILREAV